MARLITVVGFDSYKTDATPTTIYTGNSLPEAELAAAADGAKKSTKNVRYGFYVDPQVYMSKTAEQIGAIIARREAAAAEAAARKKAEASAAKKVAKKNAATSAPAPAEEAAEEPPADAESFAAAAAGTDERQGELES